MNKEIIQVAFIGAGYMTGEHIRAFADIENVAIAGIFSRTRSRAEKLVSVHKDVLVCDSIADLYEKTKADLVIVSVPILSVAEVAAECFQYPWTCLIEKPAGLNLQEAESIAASAKRMNRNAFVTLNRRQYSSTKTVLEDIVSREGNRLIHVQDQEDLIVQREAGTPEPVLNYWMYANAIHVIDYFTIMGRGEIKQVDNIVSWNPKDPGYVIAKIEYTSGDIGLYEAVWNAPGPWAISVTMPSRRWEMKPLEQAAYQEYRSRTWNTAPKNIWDTTFKPGLRLQAQEAVNAIKGLNHSLPTLEDALVTMRLVNRIYKV